MPKETQPPTKICTVCKLPIEKWQRPSVQLKNGEEMHVECFEEYQRREREKND